jgi:chromosome segregation protein
LFLKRLDLVGFKSFAPRTSTELLPGISVVVGPNGSGKSNIADGVLWVLGEQSAKAVRARKPEEVIFAGSAARQPLGMAEVSLVLDNAESSLPIEYAEVRVTRRLYRSGDSEYLLNGSRVRLKDITQLLLHAGISADGYAVIGQGSVDELILQRPDERRVAFENAADIRRHQLRLNDTRSKLAATEANLTRVQDVLAELAPHVRRLKSQADRAAKADAFRAELQRLLVRWFRERLRRARENKRRAEADLQHASNAATEAELAAQSAEQSVRTADASLLALDEQLAVLRPRAEGFREQARAAERGVAVTRERHAGLLTQRTSVLLERDQLQARLSRLTGEEEQAAQAAAPATDSAEESRAVTAARAQVAELEGRLAEAQRDHNATTAERDATEQRLVRTESQLGHAADQVRSLDAHANLEQARRADRDSRITALERQLSQHTEERARVTESIEQSSRTLGSATEQHRASAAELEHAAEALRVARQQADRLQGALTALGAAETSSARSIDGAQALLGALEGLPVVGTIAELAARVRPVDRLLRAYLARVVVLADDAATHEAHRRLEARLPHETLAWAVLSTSGLLLSAPGERVLRASDDDGRSALVEWQREVERTQHELETAHAACASAQAALVQARARLETADAAERSARAALSEREAELTQLTRAEQSIRHELQQVAAERERALQAATRQNASRTELEQRVAQLRDAVTQARAEKERAAEALRASEARLAEISARLNAAHADLSTHEAVLLRQRVQSEARQALHARIVDDVDATRAAERNAAARLAELETQIDELANRERQLVAEMEATQQQLAPIDRELATAEHRRAEAIAQRRAVESGLAQLRSYERSARGAREERHVAAQRAADELERLHLEIAETAEVENDNALVEQLRLELPGTEPAEVEAFDVESAHRRIGVLQRELRAVGGVADSVVAEYRELRERHDFLEQQSEDLRAAMAELQTAATELEEHMRERFASVFQAVEEAFVECFKVLFGGGEARLVLTHPDDLLTSGIDIVARPPGKKLQGLLSLSGGERALTIVALLFGLLKVNPTPFCVLDEVDAALDEANVQRFANLLAEFAERIQFIVVTHNRATMEKADAMYGVSMDANGVSHVFTVQPRSAAEQAVSHQPSVAAGDS